MCGICGIINLNNEPVKEVSILKMMQKIKHRGPDDDGVFLEDNIGLGFVRLSILDLSPLGHQPMFDFQRRYVIVFNGEIYNYIEIREELCKKGYKFISTTDTEVIIYSYIEWGENCLNKFNGMWAFAIFDRKEKTLFCSRDRYGVKPFYYYLDQQKFIFASEIKAILPHLKKPKPNDSVIYDYLMYNRTDHTDDTFFAGIKKICHGSVLKIYNNKVKISKWYALANKINTNVISVEEYKELFSDSLKLRLRADVPIGVCLSGGIDSSAITATLLKCFNLKDLNTFSAVYGKKEKSDESIYINEFKSSVKNMHFIYPTASTLLLEYEEFIETHNEPIPDLGPYAQFKVMELACQHVTVTLDGQGADEQLAGYHYFFGSYFRELLRELKIINFLFENYYYLRTHFSLDAIAYLFYYLTPKVIQTKISSQLYPSINIDFINQFKYKSNIPQDLLNPRSLQESHLQHFEYKLEHLLKWEDLNSMHFSIEARVPFLDFRLVESTVSLPSSKIIKKGVTKYILREALKDLIPKKIHSRMDKKGFSNPRDKWFREKEFEKIILDLINSKSFQQRGYFSTKNANKQYLLHKSGKNDYSQEIWKWLNLEIWLRKYIDSH